tara:strand:- start:92 stop:1270 length:1179 start_codon:yes stop_codon:yes gene_type:complete
MDIDNNIFLDFGSGIYVTNLGHSHPKITKAISDEAKKLMHCHDYITPVKLAYFEKLASACGDRYTNIHFYDNGTTAVEFAIKAAREITGYQDIISCFGDHHGKSIGTASIGRISHLNDFQKASNFYMVPRPDCYRPLWVDNKGKIDVDQYINFYEVFIRESTSGNIAAFLLEPVQGWNGTIIPPDDFFPKLRKFCDSNNILLIADEVLTGCGRTGNWLCMDDWGVEADITILGKGIGNGFPMSAMLAKKDYSDAISRVGPSSTFGGSPMACAAGLSTLEIYSQDRVTENSRNIGNYLLNALYELKEKYQIIGDVRGKGCLLGLEFILDRNTKEPFCEASEKFFSECLKRYLIPGIPVKNLIRIAPPLITSIELASDAISIMDDVLNHITSEL